jgi:phosphate/sulfate permease
MQITNSGFIWAITIATFFAVVLSFIIGFHVISIIRLTWKSKEDQERSKGRTGNGARRITERRRSKRLEVVRPVFVSGHRGAAEAFFEETISLQVSAHGGLLILAASVRVGQELLLATDCTQAPFQPCRVARLGSSTPLRTEVAVEFERPAPEFWQTASARS